MKRYSGHQSQINWGISYIKKRYGRFRIYFDRNDWWIGYYRGRTHHYVCPLPTLVIRWSRKHVLLDGNVPTWN